MPQFQWRHVYQFENFAVEFKLRKTMAAYRQLGRVGATDYNLESHERGDNADDATWIT
jgi:hypothetical protein